MDREIATESRVVVPGTTRLPLSHGDWVLVKRKLNAGETLDLFERAAPGIDLTRGPAALRDLSPMRTGLALLGAYLVDWSLVDPQGAPLSLSSTTTTAEREAMVRSLDFESLTELITVVTDHDARTRQEKKRHSGSSAPETSSPSLAAAGGGMNG